MNEFLNPRAPQEGNTSNTSNASNASLSTWDTMQLTSQKTTLLKNTAKAVKHLKSLVNALQHTLVRVQAKAAPASSVSLAVEDNPPLSIGCQHGGSECAGNAWESCVQDMYPDEAVFFPVVDCIEKKGCAELTSAAPVCLVGSKVCAIYTNSSVGILTRSSLTR